jgi:hypothetical protein
MAHIVDKVRLTDRGWIRLFIAIVISALLHFFWFKQLSWELPKKVTDKQIVEARLVPLKPTPVKQEEEPKKTVKKQAAKQEKPKPEKPIETKDPELTPLPPPYVPPKLPTPEPQLEPVVTDAVEVSEAIEEVPDVLPENVAMPIAAPYQYIETTFDIYLNEDQARAGEAKIIYDASAVGQYKLYWTIKATGLLALFYPDLVQSSEGLIDAAHGLRPVNYRYQFGDKANKSYQAAFNWTNQTLLLQTSKGDKTVELTPNAQDYLSFMYQFMFKPPLHTMQISLTNGKRFSSYDYSFEGEETLTLDFGEVKTYHIKHAKSNSDEKTELWLAVDYQFIPVKISKAEKDGQVINQIATMINTKPVQPIQELLLP